MRLGSPVRASPRRRDFGTTTWRRCGRETAAIGKTTNCGEDQPPAVAARAELRAHQQPVGSRQLTLGVRIADFGRCICRSQFLMADVSSMARDAR
jgi:hypothetical protein